MNSPDTDKLSTNATVLPYVSVIIPVFNDEQRLSLCLQRLVKQDYPTARFEVIVVDNGSDPPLFIPKERYENCRLFRETKPGSYAARNRGISESRGDILAFTDSDCLPEPQWLSNGVARIAAVDRNVVGSIGGRIRVFPKVRNHPNVAEAFDCVFGLNQSNNVQQFHFAATANMFTTREALNRNGPFDEELRSGGDFEWGNRLRNSVLAVEYANDVVVDHPARDTVGSLTTQKRRHAGGRTKLDKDGYTASRLFQLLLVFTRNLLPPSRSIKRIFAASGLSLLMKAKVSGVAIFLHYVHVWELIQTRFGKAAERR